MSRALCTCALSLACLLSCPGGVAAGSADDGCFIVHEWGTFLSVQGSDGVSVGGVVESEEVLPDFVYVRGSRRAMQRAFMRQKMETPVTYFYSSKPREVRVRVDMPQGTLTHWFPRVLHPSPRGKKEKDAAGTFLEWGRFQLIPARSSGAARTTSIDLPEIPADSSWRCARETDSAFVRIHAGDATNLSRHEHEKFLFYRGLGTFELPLAVQSDGAGSGLRFTLRNRSQELLPVILALEVGEEHLRFASLGALAAGWVEEVPALSLGAPLALAAGVEEVKAALFEALVGAGLFEKEAQGMLRTWESSYFRTPGLRILYLLPESTVNEVIPIRIEPQPDSLVRVMVARVEVLTPELEAELEDWVAATGDPDPKRREAARKELDRFGRLLEPALRRLIAVTTRPEVARRAGMLLAEVGRKAAVRASDAGCGRRPERRLACGDLHPGPGSAERRGRGGGGAGSGESSCSKTGALRLPLLARDARNLELGAARALPSYTFPENAAMALAHPPARPRLLPRRHQRFPP